MMTLKQLRYFAALAQHGHFGRAADACAISQPALSLQMKELEQTLGAPLIERGGRRIRLTPLGVGFALRARAILRAVDDLSDLARASGRALSGRLGIGMIPTVAPYLLPGVMTRLASAFPELDLHPREAVTHRLIEDLLEARLDVAVVALPISEPELQEYPLFSEEFVLVRPLSDRDRPVPGPETLRAMRLLLLEEGHCFRDQALAFCRLSAGAPRELMEGTSLATLVQMVGAGIGVTLVPEMALPTETAAARVSVARLAPPRPSRRIGMIWRRTSPLAGRYAEIADLVRDEYTALRGRG